MNVNPASPDTHLHRNFLLALQKMIKIGAYYQHGHKLLISTIKNFQLELSRLAGNNPGVCFHFEQNMLLLEGCELSEKSAFAQEFETLLTDLGIIRLEIRKEIQAQELQSFFQNLISTQFKLRSSQGFRQVPQIKPIPSSITLVQQQFLVADYEFGTNPDGQRTQATIALLLDKLYKKGISDEQLLRCHSILKELSLESATKQIVQRDKNLPFISWEDVERLLIRATTDTSAAQPIGKIQTDSIADLAAILDHLEDEDTRQQSKNSIDFLLRQIKRLYDTSPLDPRQRASAEPGKERVNIAPGSLSDIVLFLDKNPFNFSLREEINDRTHKEDISILLQMMKLDRASKHTEALQKYFQDILLDFSTAAEWQLFIEGMHDITTTCEPNRITDVMQIVTTSLRMTTPVSNLPMASHLPPYSNLLFFRDLLQRNDEHGLRRLWPFAFNEVVQFGGSDSGETLNQILGYLSRLPRLEQEQWLAFLENLDSFQELKLAADIFSSAQPANYPILSLLTATRLKEAAYDKIFSDFLQKPPDWLIRAVMPFLNRQIHFHQDFMVTYLRQGQVNKPSKVLTMMAGKIMIDGLRNIPDDQRRDPFVASAIKALPLFPNQESSELLHEIAHNKKMLFLSSWPQACRQAAQEALASTRKPSR